MTRGFACIALDNPKDKANVGGVMRAAFIYSASMIVIAKGRFQPVGTDTCKAWRHMPVVHADDVFDIIPYGCVPIAVDLVEDAIPLPAYEHPQRAFYIFGAEDATLGTRILSRCRDRVFIPMRACMNLAACVNVVLYDRSAKQQMKEAAE